MLKINSAGGVVVMYLNSQKKLKNPVHSLKRLSIRKIYLLQNISKGPNSIRAGNTIFKSLVHGLRNCIHLKAKENKTREVPILPDT